MLNILGGVCTLPWWAQGKSWATCQLVGLFGWPAVIAFFAVLAVVGIYFFVRVTR